MIVKIFLDTAGNFEEREILNKFYQGALLHANNELEVLVEYGGFSACDVGVILGSWKPRDSEHHNIRNSVVEQAPVFFVIETPLLGRVVNQRNKYHRIGANGFLNHSGVFNLDNHNNTRLQELDITWNEWNQNKKGHVLLMLQLPGDASLRGIDQYEWAVHTIKKIRSITDRPIVVRTHPEHSIKDTDGFHKLVSTVNIFDPQSKVSFSLGKNRSLTQDLKGAYCSVSYTSGSAIDSICAGVPVIACDSGNFAWDISTNFVEDIENIKLAEPEQVQQWLNNLSYSQWSPKEMQDGVAWQHLMSLFDNNLVPPNSFRRYSKK